MDLSIGVYAIILLFIYLIIPGAIARRFYFHGEFSKQINLSQNVILQIVYSSFVGLIIILSFVTIINLIPTFHIDTDNALTVFDNYFLSDVNTKNLKKFTGTTSNIYHTYFPFIFCLYLFSSFLGYFLCKIVLFLKLDIRYKFLRFKNNYYYIFSGKILEFNKVSISTFKQKLQVKHVFIDVLVGGESEKPILYSGLLADYDLCPYNINKIERIHLLNASRYKKTDNGTILKQIPGRLFTIMGDKILNINCTYISYEEDEIKNKKFNRNKNILLLSQVSMVFMYVFSIIILFSNIGNFGINFLSKIISQPLIYRLLLIFGLNIFVGLLAPFTIDNKNKKLNFIGWENFVAKILLIIIVSFILYIFY